MSEEETDRRRAAERPAEKPPVIRSQDLLQGGRETIIRHGDDDYRLRLTRAGKLILNK